MLFIPQWFMMTIVMLQCHPMKSGNPKPHLTASNVGSISRTAAKVMVLACERISIKRAPSLFLMSGTHGKCLHSKASVGSARQKDNSSRKKILERFTR